jgi:hypothetical protein
MASPSVICACIDKLVVPIMALGDGPTHALMYVNHIAYTVLEGGG